VASGKKTVLVERLKVHHVQTQYVACVAVLCVHFVLCILSFITFT
jgi:hypothetical protein